MPALLMLVRFSQRRLAELFGVRAARLYGIGIGLSFGFMMALLPRPVTASTLEALLIRALTSASWAVAGLTSLSVARDLVKRDREEGIVALVEQRGHDPRALELSRALGAAAFIALWVAAPSGALAVFAWFRLAEPAQWLWALGWLGFIAVYALTLGVVIGSLARGASRLVPERGRLLLAIAVLGPELVRVIWPSTPSIPAAFAWALQRVRGLDSLWVAALG